MAFSNEFLIEETLLFIIFAIYLVTIEKWKHERLISYVVLICFPLFALSLLALCKYSEVYIDSSIHGLLYQFSVFPLVILCIMCAISYGIFIVFVRSWDIERLAISIETKISDYETYVKQSADSRLVRNEEGLANPTATDLLKRPETYWNLPDPKKAIPGLISLHLSLSKQLIDQIWDGLRRSRVVDFPFAGSQAAIDVIADDTASQKVMDKIALENAYLGIFNKFFLEDIFKYGVRNELIQRLVFRFFSQMILLFISTTLVFFSSVAVWATYDPSIFNPAPTFFGELTYVADLMLKGCLFIMAEYFGLNVTHLTVNYDAHVFSFYSLAYRLFVSLFAIVSIFKAAKLLFGIVRRYGMVGPSLALYVFARDAAIMTILYTAMIVLIYHLFFHGLAS